MEKMNEPDQGVQEHLVSLIPEAGELERSEQVILHGLVRRAIEFERRQEKEAVSIFKPENTEALRELKESLENTAEDVKQARVEEYGLSEEEAEMELSNWAFRHQSARGEMMVGDALVPFRMVRFSEFQYLLLVEQRCDDIMQAFIPVFEKIPDVASAEAFHTEKGSWVGWVWITEPDEVRATILKEQIVTMWGGDNES